MNNHLFDIHTHKIAGGNALAIQNLSNNFDSISAKGKYSCGLHPWFITEETLISDFALLNAAISFPNVVAIGECGLDRVCNTSFSLQMKAFVMQVKLANSSGKPLIIHCVRAYNEVLSILNQEKNKMPVIFHGYNKGEALAIKLIECGYYLSFGESLLLNVKNKIFEKIPIEKIFLETDNSPLTIESIFIKASLLKKIEINLLSLQITKNAEEVFGKHFFNL